MKELYYYVHRPPQVVVEATGKELKVLSSLQKPNEALPLLKQLERIERDVERAEHVRRLPREEATGKELKVYELERRMISERTKEATGKELKVLCSLCALWRRFSAKQLGKN